MDRVGAGPVELCREVLGPDDGALMVLVAGLGRPLTAWDDGLCDLLVAAGLRVMRFDNRDAGWSRWRAEPGPYSLDDMADDTVALLDDLGVASAHVVGTSMGGMIAQVLAYRHPGRVRSMASIMATTGAPGVGAPTEAALSAMMTRMAGEPSASRDAFVAAELAVYGVIGSRRSLEDQAWRRRRFAGLFERTAAPEATRRQIAAVVASGDRTAALGAVRAPTLVVHGEVDTLVTPGGGEATARAVPGAELLMVPDLGHEIPPGVWPELVAALVANAGRGEERAGSGRAGNGAWEGVS